MELWYIELHHVGYEPRLREWEYYDSTDNDKCSVYNEWKNFNTKYLHFYYHKPLLF